MLPRWLSGKKRICLSMQETDTGDAGLIPGLERTPGGVYGKPLQYFCLETPTDRGDWHATVHRVAVGHDGTNEHTHTYPESLHIF